MIPRIGAPPLSHISYRLRPGAYCVLPKGGRILLTEEFDGIPDIQLPGGGIDPGESPLHALHREVMEETGWTLARPRRLGAFRRFVFMPEYDMWAEKLCHVFVAHPCRQVRNPIEPHHRTLWMTGDRAVRALGNNGDRLYLSRYLKTR